MADEKEAPAPETSLSQTPAPAGGSKIVLIASLVNMVATIGIVAVLFLSFQKEKSRETVEDVVAGHAEAGHGGGEAEGGHGGGHGEGGGEHGEKKGGGEDLADSGKILPLDPFTVNLASNVGSTPRYIRLNVSIELEKGAQEKEFDVKRPRVRDTIINLLNSKKASELSSVDGREQLKDEIKKTVNSFMLQSKVKDVYFTNFAISNP
ncbi:MAG: flagellar basal body-associated FliL family protein [Bacteriovoracia bacterium]